ncbi:hypothetical protein [Aminobacter niigataensis]|uniref:hypothetical protein n=1 Tax=Aminobacter niigataensis TaxID=83265 RepID=UPI0024CA3EC6|nr:hypothetical protein [Aminobacter niigataensis]CAI2936240.1 protein of unknown function [Aminobacter niigataensis]
MGKPAGKLELAWYRINGAAPWGYIFVAMFMAVIMMLLIGAATGLLKPGKSNGLSTREDPNCVRYSFNVNSCE